MNNDILSKLANTDKRSKKIKQESDEGNFYPTGGVTHIDRDTRVELDSVETPVKQKRRGKTSYTRGVQQQQRQQHNPLSQARNYDGGSMITNRSKVKKRRLENKHVYGVASLGAALKIRDLSPMRNRKKTGYLNSDDDDSSTPPSPKTRNNSFLEIHDELQNLSSSSSSPSFKNRNKMSTPTIDIDNFEDSESNEKEDSIYHEKIPLKHNHQKSSSNSTNQNGTQNSKCSTPQFGLSKVNGKPSKSKSKGPKRQKAVSIIPGRSLDMLSHNESFNAEIFNDNDDIISSSQESFKHKYRSVCRMDDEEEYTPPKRKNNSSGKKKNGGGMLANIGIGGFFTGDNGIFSQAKRFSARKKKPKQPDVIDISSDEESVFEDTSSQVRSPSPTIARIPLSQEHSPFLSPNATIPDLPPIDQPRKFGQCTSLYPIRISFDNKVFSHECEVRFQTGTADPYIQLAYKPKKKDQILHKIYTEHNDLIEMSYFLEDDDNDDDDFNISSDPINILYLVVDASEENGLLKFCKETTQQSSLEDAPENNSSRRKRTHSVANNQIDIVIELRSASEYKEKMDAIMEKCDTIRDMLDENKSKLSKIDAKDVAKPILEDIDLEKLKQFELEDSYAKRRVTRSGQKASKNKWKNASEVLLIYPFEAKSNELDSATKGLTQLFIQESNDNCLINDSSSDVDAKTQYAHYLTVHESDRGRLEQGEFLNDTNIDFWMSWMWRKENHKTSKVHFFSSHFFSTLQEKGPSGVSRWTSKKNIDIFSKTFIFIPINESLHWSLCVVCNPGEIMNAASYHEGDSFQKERLKDELMPCILFMDSLKAHRKMKVAKFVREWLNFKWGETKGGIHKMFNKETLPIFDPQVPYQNNSWDCGVFVCRYALALYQMRNESITFSHTKRLDRIITHNSYFDFDMTDIREFRNQLATLVDRLSKVYSKHNKKYSSNDNKNTR